MEQIMNPETFNRYLTNAVESRNRAYQMQGKQEHFSVLEEAEVLGEPPCRMLLWDPAGQTDEYAVRTEGYLPAYKVDDLYKLYQEQSGDGKRKFFQEMLEALSDDTEMEMLQKILNKRQESLGDREYLLAHVYPAVILTDGSDDFLKNLPNRRAQDTDLTIYYYVELNFTLSDGREERSYVYLTNDLMEEAKLAQSDSGQVFELTEAQIFEAARMNMERNTRVEGMEHKLLREFAESVGKVSLPENVHIQGEHSYVISTPDRPFGAAAAFTLCGLDEVAAHWKNSPFYLIPYSINEVWAFPVNGTENAAVLSMEQRQRNLLLPPNQRLSESVYYYDPAGRELFVDFLGEPVSRERVPSLPIPPQVQTAGVPQRGR